MTDRIATALLVVFLAGCAEPSPEPGTPNGGEVGGAPENGAETSPDGDAADGDDDVAPAPDGGIDTSGMHPVVARFVERAGEDALVRRDACPFECCVYREWLAQEGIAVRASPDAGGDVVATIPAGQRFDARSGFVRVTSPIVVAVTGPADAWRVEEGVPGGGEAVSLEAGDSLLVVDYEGEGSWFALRDGVLLSVPQFWPSPGVTLDPVRGEVIGGPYESEWWVRVTTREGVEGWIDADAAEIGNADACG